MTKHQTPDCLWNMRKGVHLEQLIIPQKNGFSMQHTHVIRFEWRTLLRGAKETDIRVTIKSVIVGTA